MGLTGGFRLLPPAWVAIVFHFSGIIIVWGILVKKKGTKTSVTGCGSFLLQKFFRAFLFWRFFLINKHGEFWSLRPLVATNNNHQRSEKFFYYIKNPIGDGVFIFHRVPPYEKFFGEIWTLYRHYARQFFRNLSRSIWTPYF